MAQGFFYSGYDFFGDLVAERLAPAGWERTDDVAGAKLVVTYCQGLQAHEDAYYEEGGIMTAIRPGTLLVDLTPTSPRMARDLAVIAKSSGVVAVEAPLVVADPAAKEPFVHRGLACFAAGEKDALEQTRPVLDLLVGTVYQAGSEPGSACLARATYTVQSTAQIVAMAEAHALVQGVVEQLGSSVSPQGTAGAITPLGTAVSNAIADERFSNGYTVQMLATEVAAALDAAEEGGVVLPLMESCLQVLELLVLADAGSMSPAAVSLVYAEQEVAAKHGVDWNAAERALSEKGGCGCGHDDCDCDGDCGDDCTCDHHGRGADDDDEDDDDSPFRNDYDGWDTLRFDDDDDWN
ncbi:MAG: NAD(P)-binding domain-containing protein [Coriobacteriia bacterium]|nr:NAD(P)-binding domain-containing protein [Coriobacteriia bacterium]